MQPTVESLSNLARGIRGEVIDGSHRARTPHLGSALSCVDILVAAYWRGLQLDPSRPDDPTRDRLIFSKGHAILALYVVLARRGYYAPELLAEYAVAGGRLPEHPAPGCVPGLDWATGSLGHGLPVGCGQALAARIRGERWRTMVVMSDGECNEGSVWEAAMFAAAQRLDRLAVVIDYNKWQATGRSDEVLALPSLAEKWRAFGWTAVEVDGHDLAQLVDVLSAWPGDGRPLAVVAHTVKGRGVSFMEDDNNWHYRIPTADEVALARAELGLA